MRLLTWNVANRIKRQPEQAAEVLSAAPDVVCLQEVTANSLPLWRAALADAGFGAGLTPLDTFVPPKPRRLGVLIAAREGLAVAPLAIEAQLPWEERAIAATVDGVEVVCTHSPISPSPGLAKVLHHEALYGWLRDRPGPIVVAGDLNTPRRDPPDGSVLTFAHESNGALRPERGQRWHDAEAALVWRLRAEHGWRDPFLDAPERTWTFARDKGGWRLDHVLVRGLEVTARAYVHEWRRDGLSDHSALLADLAV